MALDTPYYAAGRQDTEQPRGKTMGKGWLLARVSDPGYNIPTYLGEMGQRVGREDFLELSGV